MDQNIYIYGGVEKWQQVWVAVYVQISVDRVFSSSPLSSATADHEHEHGPSPSLSPNAYMECNWPVH